MTWSRIGLIALFLLTSFGGAWADDSSTDPRITAQGFSIDAPLRAEASQFSSVRVRVEAPLRIAKLLITDGDVEIDLATTPDRSLFAMFGLDQRPMNAFDITLDFAPYINDRLTDTATYRIGITVVDHDGRVAHDAMTATVIDDDAAAAEAGDAAPRPQPLEESILKLQRQGAGDVEPASSSPLSWVTHEAINVTIRIRPADPRTALRELPASNWDSILTHDSLERQLAGISSQPYVDVQAARNGAAGTVVALSRGDGNAMIRLTGSATSVSTLGTTVILTATVRD